MRGRHCNLEETRNTHFMEVCTILCRIPRAGIHFTLHEYWSLICYCHTINKEFLNADVPNVMSLQHKYIHQPNKK